MVQSGYELQAGGAGFERRDDECMSASHAWRGPRDGAAVRGPLGGVAACRGRRRGAVDASFELAVAMPWLARVLERWL